MCHVPAIPATTYFVDPLNCTFSVTTVNITKIFNLYLFQAIVANKRIKSFLVADELNPLTIDRANGAPGKCYNLE